MNQPHVSHTGSHSSSPDTRRLFTAWQRVCECIREITQCMAITHTSFYVGAHSEQTLLFANLHMLHKLNLWLMLDGSLRCSIQTLCATSHWSHCADANFKLGFKPKLFSPLENVKECKKSAERNMPSVCLTGLQLRAKTRKERQLKSEVKVKLFLCYLRDT